MNINKIILAYLIGKYLRSPVQTEVCVNKNYNAIEDVKYKFSEKNLTIGF